MDNDKRQQSSQQSKLSRINENEDAFEDSKEDYDDHDYHEENDDDNVQQEHPPPPCGEELKEEHVSPPEPEVEEDIATVSLAYTCLEKSSRTNTMTRKGNNEAHPRKRRRVEDYDDHRQSQEETDFDGVMDSQEEAKSNDNKELTEEDWARVKRERARMVSRRTRKRREITLQLLKEDQTQLSSKNASLRIDNERLRNMIAMIRENREAMTTASRQQFSASSQLYYQHFGGSLRSTNTRSGGFQTNNYHLPMVLQQQSFLFNPYLASSNPNSNTSSSNMMMNGINQPETIFSQQQIFPSGEESSTRRDFGGSFNFRDTTTASTTNEEDFTRTVENDTAMSLATLGASSNMIFPTNHNDSTTPSNNNNDFAADSQVVAAAPTYHPQPPGLFSLLHHHDAIISNRRSTSSSLLSWGQAFHQQRHRDNEPSSYFGNMLNYQSSALAMPAGHGNMENSSSLVHATHNLERFDEVAPCHPVEEPSSSLIIDSSMLQPTITSNERTINQQDDRAIHYFDGQHNTSATYDHLTTASDDDVMQNDKGEGGQTNSTSTTTPVKKRN